MGDLGALSGLLQEMLGTTPITFAVAVNDKEVFESNFLSSPSLHGLHTYEILSQEGFTSASKAYNDAIDRSGNDLIVFAHQDVFLPETWPSQLATALECLQVLDPHWGVLGCYGKSQDGRGWGHVYSSGRGIIGDAFNLPVEIQTLDEIVLIVRKSSGLRFDEQLPHFHLYGADICLAASKRGMRSYAISAFCIHNTQQNLVLPREFYECCAYFKRTWKDYLPIQTTCVRLTKFNLPLYKRRIQELGLRFRGQTIGAARSNTPPGR